LIVTVAALLLLLVLHKRTNGSFSPAYPFTLLALIAFFLLGASRAAMRKPQFQSEHFQQSYQAGMDMRLRVLSGGKPSQGVYRYEAEVLRIGDRSSRGVVFLRIDTTGITRIPRYGDELLCIPVVREISSNRNPGGFDFKAYALTKGIERVIWLSRDEFQILESRPKGIRVLANELRRHVIRSLNEYAFGKEELAVIQALLLGQRNDLSESLLQSYRTAGAVHVLAVSGLHVGILLLFFRFLLHPLLLLPGGKPLRLFFLVLLIWAYALLAGMSASVIRAASMFSALSLGLYANRTSSASRALVVSFFVLLLADPLYLFDVGFQLSYAAVFGILWFGPLLESIWKPRRKWLAYPWKLIAVSCSAQFGILPLSFFYFHGFSPLFIFSSLAIVPFLGIILGTGVLVLTLATMHALPLWLVQGYGAIIYAMNALIKTFSAMELLVIEGVYFSLALAVLLYALLLALGSWLHNRTPKSLFNLCISVFCIQLAILHHKVATESGSEFVVCHLSRDSMIILRRGRHIQAYFGKGSARAKRVVQDFAAQYARAETEWPEDKQLFKLRGKTIYILDPAFLPSLKAVSPDILVLRNSPRVNLERYLRDQRPEAVVADGSNYVSYLRLWERSCKSENIRFHSTYRDGAFILSEAP